MNYCVSWSELGVGTTAPTATTPPPRPWQTFQPAEPEAESPFKGLHYFDESDAHLFFGREQLTAELVDHLRQHRFLAVVGASGSGKSSLVRAGVIPAIRRGEIRQNGHSSARWPIHLITPGDEPLKALAATLTRDSESVTALKALLTDLRTNAESLDLFLFRHGGRLRGRILLVVDQFEELFTQCDDPEERRLFVENLVCAAESGKQGRLSLILTLRADFYAHAVQYEGLRPLLETRQKIVGAMNGDELRRAIEAPTAQDNWQFQPGLVETMLQDVGREPGALPLLSHALRETSHPARRPCHDPGRLREGRRWGAPCYCPNRRHRLRQPDPNPTNHCPQHLPAPHRTGRRPRRHPPPCFPNRTLAPG